MKSKRIFVGIDWADAQHAFHLIADDQIVQSGDLKQQARAIDILIQAWRRQFPGATFNVAIEQSKGPLITALLKYEDVIIYPINPAALANYRKAFAHGGGKNDPNDAQLLAEYLQHYLDKLRPLRQDKPLTQELAAFNEFCPCFEIP